MRHAQSASDPVGWGARAFRLLPSEVGGLSTAQQQLNQSLGGRLEQALPLAEPCFSDPQGEACIEFQDALTSRHPGSYRIARYAGFQYAQGEGCASDPVDQCFLDETTLSPPVNSTCQQGMVSPYHVEVVDEHDVQATISIKNSGHDYVMRSSRRGSLALWTKGLKEMTYHDRFVPNGCIGPQTTKMAITYGAGVTTDKAYVFAHANNVLFARSTTSTIGASGGLGVDRVLQFKIVTPDGGVRIANKCTNKDLFWALRGGGGGTFGLVLSSTMMVTRDAPITAVVLGFPATADNVGPWVSLLAENMPRWAVEGWGGPSGANLSLLSNTLLNAFDYFFEYWAQVVNGSLAAPQPISTATLMTSRASQAGLAVFMLTTPPFMYARDHPGQETSLHSAWYKSVWIATASLGWAPSSLLSVRQDAVALLRNTTNSWMKVAPEGCTYANEADPWIENWTTEFWDPDGLLSCWHCVGWHKSMPDHECISGLSQ
ncbi:hypothetical protein GGR54DRAFT_634445 [Hypoxylon sp. NC1633]|nr:hypothetical protein GGR54DRAFT_634445 [Hypoxylon sp. NC1633]